MQWTREGAHSVLQVRASIMSNEWPLIWEDAVMNSFALAA